MLKQGAPVFNLTILNCFDESIAPACGAVSKVQATGNVLELKKLGKEWRFSLMQDENQN